MAKVIRTQKFKKLGSWTEMNVIKILINSDVITEYGASVHRALQIPSSSPGLVTTKTVVQGDHIMTA